MDNGLEEIKREFMEMTDEEIIKEAERIENERKAHRRYEISRGLYFGFLICSMVVTLVLFIVGFVTKNSDMQAWGMLVLIIAIFSHLGLLPFVS